MWGPEVRALHTRMATLGVHVEALGTGEWAVAISRQRDPHLRALGPFFWLGCPGPKPQEVCGRNPCSTTEIRPKSSQKTDKVLLVETVM